VTLTIGLSANQGAPLADPTMDSYYEYTAGYVEGHQAAIFPPILDTSTDQDIGALANPIGEFARLTDPASSYNCPPIDIYIAGCIRLALPSLTRRFSLIPISGTD